MISGLNCEVYSSLISYRAPRCAKSAEKSGFKFIKSGGLSLKTEASVLFSPSENGTSIHLILISGFSFSNSEITPVIYGAKSFICKVQKTTSFAGEFDGFRNAANNIITNIAIRAFTYFMLQLYYE